MPAFHERIKDASPELADRAVTELDDWDKIAFLSVTGGRLEKWSTPGLMLIGDAAHIMTPIGGVGINYAIWDAVETANVIVPAIKQGKVIDSTLFDEIQKRREPETRHIQTLQKFAGRRVVGPAAGDDEVRFQFPFIIKIIAGIPFLRDLPPRFIAFGSGGRTRIELDEYL